MKITLYAVPETLTSPKSDTPYLLEALREHFDVSVFNEPDVELARDADVVFCRFKMPMRPDFLRALAPWSGTKLIINDPNGQLRLHNKRSLLGFPELIPPTIISESLAEIRDFVGEQGEIVFKPLDRHGGVGVIKLDSSDVNGSQMEDRLAGYLTDYGTPMVQRFVPEVVTSGSKRLNVFGYDVISVENSMPAEGSFMCHDAFGATLHPAELTSTDRVVLDGVIPVLRQNGIWWAGIDMMGPFLGEINVVQPNTIKETDQQHGNQRGLHAMIAKLEEYRVRNGI